VGKDYHTAVVADILERAGVPETALRCDVPGRPLLRHGCSGKHAGMLVTARHLGEPLDGYAEPEHPVQRRIRAILAILADAAGDAVPAASDGCSVPTFAMTLEQMALAFARLADPAGLPSPLGEACARIAAAMGAYPELLSGAEGDTADLTSPLVRLKAPTLVAKSGAESLFCVGVAPGILGPRGVGIAVRAEDGGHVQRSCYLPTAEALRQLGVLDAAEVAALDPYLARTVRNVHGTVVGEVRPVFRLHPRDQP
jgi:L-asparaginase II